MPEAKKFFRISVNRSVYGFGLEVRKSVLQGVDAETEVTVAGSKKSFRISANGSVYGILVSVAHGIDTALARGQTLAMRKRKEK